MPKDISMEEVKKMHDVKGVIFDLDGVICFTDDFHYLAWKKIADELGIKVNVDFKDKIRGISRMDSLEILLGKYSSSFTSEEKKLLADRKNTYVQSAQLNFFNGYMKTRLKLLLDPQAEMQD